MLIFEPILILFLATLVKKRITEFKETKNIHVNLYVFLKKTLVLK